MFKCILYKIGLFLLHRLPPKVFYRFAAFISDIQYFFSFRDRRAVKNNLKNILPSKKNVSPLARNVFRNFGRYLGEFFLMKEMVDDAFIKNKVHIQGTEHLDRVLEEGKGGIIVTAHIGNWELGAVLISALGYPIMAVALPHKERPVNDLFNQQRESKGVTVVPTNIALRKCIEQLKDNKFIALVADRDFTTSGIVTEFLGCQALVPKGPAVFSLKKGAPIIPTFLIRNDDGTFNLSFDEPIYPPGEMPDPKEKDILTMIHRYLSVIEDQIRAHPSQWLVFREFSVK